MVAKKRNYVYVLTLMRIEHSSDSGKYSVTAPTWESKDGLKMPIRSFETGEHVTTA